MTTPSSVPVPDSSLSPGSSQSPGGRGSDSGSLAHGAVRMETVEQFSYLKSRAEPIQPGDHKPTYDRLCRKILLAPRQRKFADRLWLIRFRKDVAFGSVLFGILVPTSAIGFKFAAVSSGSAHLFPDGFQAMMRGEVAGFYWVMALLVALVSSRNIFQLYYESHKTPKNFFWALVVVLIVELTWLTVPFTITPWDSDNVGMAVGCDVAVLIAYLAGFVFNTLVYGSRFVEDQISDDLRVDASFHEQERSRRLAAAREAEVHLGRIREQLAQNRDTDGKLARYDELETQCQQLGAQIAELASRESSAIESARRAESALADLEGRYSSLRLAYFSLARFLTRCRSARNRVELNISGSWPATDSLDEPVGGAGAGLTISNVPKAGGSSEIIDPILVPVYPPQVEPA